MVLLALLLQSAVSSTRKKVAGMFILMSVCKYVNRNVKFNRYVLTLGRSNRHTLKHIFYLLYHTCYINCCKQHFSVEWSVFAAVVCPTYIKDYFSYGKSIAISGMIICAMKIHFILQVYGHYIHSHVLKQASVIMLLTWGRFILTWRNGIA